MLAPVGFREIRLNFDIDCDASPEQIDTLMKLTERYCVVLQTLRAPLIITATQTSSTQSARGAA